MEKIELYNQISREIVKNYNTYLHPEDVKILTSIEVPPHHTIVNRIETKLAKKIYNIASDLKGIDNSITINDFNNYHITLFWKNIDADLPSKVEEIKEIICNSTYSFNVEELLFGPLGISLKFYPTDETFVDTRFKLSELTGTKVLVDERFVTTWVHLGAFTQIPKPEVRKYIQENSNINLGSYTAKEFTLYKSTNKWLIDPEKIADFNCRAKN